MEYEEFLKTKVSNVKNTGFDIELKQLNPILFDFQKLLVRWALKLGKAALFTMTGTGKTLMQVEYAYRVKEKEKCNCLIVAPLAVSYQTIKEALKLNVDITRYDKEIKLIDPSIYIVNYEQLHNVDISLFDCVVLDESSILKNYAGKTRNEIIEKFRNYKYKLACTATPAPTGS